jgi:hypothetical protein
LKKKTKTGKNNRVFPVALSENYPSKINSNILKCDCCVKIERGFCEGACSQKKPLLVSSNSSPFVLQPLLKKKTKTGKNNRVFPVALSEN